MDLYILIQLALVGVVTGVLTGVTGSSGVLVVVPALSYMGLKFQDAVGVSLLVDIFTTLPVVITYWRGGSVNGPLSLSMGLGSLAGAQFGALTAKSLPEAPLELAFSLFALVMSVVSFRRGMKGSGKRDSAGGGQSLSRQVLSRRSVLFSSLLSIPVGVSAGTLGTSGGIMFIAIMIGLGLEMRAQEMVGTATLAMLVSASSAAESYAMNGMIPVLYSSLIILSSVISGLFFARASLRMKQSSVYYFLGTVFAIVFISMLGKIL